MLALHYGIIGSSYEIVSHSPFFVACNSSLVYVMTNQVQTARQITAQFASLRAEGITGGDPFSPWTVIIIHLLD